MAKNLIYQYWRGDPPPEAAASRKNISAWAERIGADYLFEDNPTFKNIPGGPLSRPNYMNYYTAFRPVFDEEFDVYDNILFLDCDIVCVEGLDVNIFEQGYKGIGIVNEPHKEEMHQTTDSHLNWREDERWAKMLKENWNKDVIRNAKGQVGIYNTGVVLYDREARQNARENWLPFETYIQWCRRARLEWFYGIDQNYLIANMIVSEYTVMDPGWNCFIHFNGKKDITGQRPIWDGRAKVKEPKLVHVMLRGVADKKGEKWHDMIVNKPKEKWIV